MVVFGLHKQKLKNSAVTVIIAFCANGIRPKSTCLQ